MYTTEEIIENYMNVDIDNTLSNQIDDWITAAASFIDKYTNNTFEQTTAEARTFDGKGGSIFYLEAGDDLISVTSLQTLNLDGTVNQSLSEGQSNDYLLYPLNTTPKFEIRLTVSNSIGTFPKGNSRIKITGNWGYSSVPKDIELACTMLVADIINLGIKSGDGNVKSSSLGDYSITYSELAKLFSGNDAVKAILDLYRDFTPG